MCYLCDCRFQESETVIIHDNINEKSLKQKNNFNLMLK